MALIYLALVTLLFLCKKQRTSKGLPRPETPEARHSFQFMHLRATLKAKGNEVGNEYQGEVTLMTNSFSVGSRVGYGPEQFFKVHHSHLSTDPVSGNLRARLQVDDFVLTLHGLVNADQEHFVSLGSVVIPVSLYSSFIRLLM